MIYTELQDTALNALNKAWDCIKKTTIFEHSSKKPSINDKIWLISQEVILHYATKR